MTAFHPLRTLEDLPKLSVMKRRRIGCMVFGIGWAALFVLMNFGLALGHPADENAVDPLKVLLWIEVGVLVAGAALFIWAEMRDPEV